jgi:competence protein ComGC
MKSKLTNQSCKALTLVEVLVVIVVLVVLVNVVLPMFTQRRTKSTRISCVNNLKQIGTALHIWAFEHNDLCPIQVPARDGGTEEFATGLETFRHFQALANELGQATKIVVCPNDAKRKPAESFANGFDNSTLSYFIGLDTVETNTAMFLAGDRNLSDTDEMRHGLFAGSTNRSVKWIKGLHSQGERGAGNILLNDGSVQQASSLGVQSYWKNSGVPTNRLALP